MALGFAVVLAATPGAIAVPASAAPAAVAAPARVGQEPNDPLLPEDPADEPWTGEEEDEESDAEADSSAPRFLVKPSIVIPDSLRSGKGAFIPAGGAPAETLAYKPPGVGIGAGAKPPAAKPKERRTPFGIHPAAFFVVLLAGHIFIVRAVTD
ncbi:MAG: hypothetical protein AABZ94_08905 [Candidatus Eisenbacteria bacterium]